MKLKIGVLAITAACLSQSVLGAETSSEAEKVIDSHRFEVKALSNISSDCQKNLDQGYYNIAKKYCAKIFSVIESSPAEVKNLFKPHEGEKLAFPSADWCSREENKSACYQLMNVGEGIHQSLKATNMGLLD